MGAYLLEWMVMGREQHWDMLEMASLSLIRVLSALECAAVLLWCTMFICTTCAGAVTAGRRAV